jgi:hypothetical protein
MLIKTLVAMYYPINAIFNKILPKFSFFTELHNYLLNFLDSQWCRLVSNRAKLELARLKKSKHRKITLVWDCYTSPVTYGDFIEFCSLARYLKSIDYEVNFFIAADKFRYDWDVVYSSPQRKGWFIDQLKEIGEFLIPDTDVKVIKNKFSEIDFNLSTSHTPFLREVKARNHHYIFKCAIVMTEIEFKESPSEHFLLENLYRRDLLGVDDYISWHIRASSVHASAEDEKPEDILKYYELISSEVDLPIVIISSAGAVPYLKDLLGKKGNVIFSKDFLEGFLSDAKLVLGSRLYIQLGWGGAFTIPACSNIPYLGPPIAKIYSGWEKHKPHVVDDFNIRPWATLNQKTFLDEDDFKVKLRDLSNRLYLKNILNTGISIDEKKL